MDWFTAEIVYAMLGVIGLVIGLVINWRVKDAATRAKVAKVIEAAYWAVEDIKLKTDTRVDDAVAEALKYLHRRLTAERVNVTYDVMELAKASWSAMHGKKKTELRIASAGAGGQASSDIDDKMKRAAAKNGKRRR